MHEKKIGEVVDYLVVFYLLIKDGTEILFVFFLLKMRGNCVIKSIDLPIR